MVKLKLTILFISLILNGVNLVSSEPLTYRFLGYKNDAPVFGTIEDSKFCRYKDSLITVGEFDSNLKPMFVNDVVDIFINKTQKNQLIVKKGSKNISLELTEKPYSICATNSGDSIFYTNYNEDGAGVTLLTNGKSTELSNIKAAKLETVIGKYLYYLKYTEKGYPWIDVCRIRIDGDYNSETILNNLHIEKVNVLPNGNIVTSVFFNGEFISVVYNFINKKFNKLSCNGYKQGYYPFKIADNGLYFYKAKGFKVYEVSLENELCLERHLPKE